MYKRQTEHKLPGLIPGRGVLEVRFGAGPDALHVLILHMALGRRGRLRQIEFLAELVRDYRHVILMGDLNCGYDSLEMTTLLAAARLRAPIPGLNTFPSWRPDRQLDHILVSTSIKVERARVLDHTSVSYTHLDVYKRQAQTAREKFRVYGSYAESFRDYTNLLRNNPRFSEVLGQKDGAQFSRSLQQSGYATDSMYADKLSRIINGATLRQALACLLYTSRPLCSL